MCNTLYLPLKKKWFEMIKSGEKKEEYREIKPYYTSRFYGKAYEYNVKNGFIKTSCMDGDDYCFIRNP